MCLVICLELKTTAFPKKGEVDRSWDGDGYKQNGAWA